MVDVTQNLNKLTKRASNLMLEFSDNYYSPEEMEVVDTPTSKLTKKKIIELANRLKKCKKGKKIVKKLKDRVTK